MVKNEENISLNTQAQDFREDIGIQILILRKKLNVKQYELAEAMQISNQTLSLIENGKKELSRDLALRLYFVLERTVEEYKDTNSEAVNIIVEFKTQFLLPYIVRLSKSINL